MKLRTIKKYLFKEFNLDTLRQVKPAYNSFLLLYFSEHKKYRYPFKGKNPFLGESIKKLLWKQEKEEWYNLLSLHPYCKLPNKFRGYAEAYCQWYEKYLKNID